jgi:hypothetical protein
MCDDVERCKHFRRAWICRDYVDWKDGYVDEGEVMEFWNLGIFVV